MSAGLRNMLTGKTGALAGQGVRYVVAGGIAFAVDFILLKICTEQLSIHYVASAAIGFTAGLVITYLLSIYWIFDRRKFAGRRAEFIIFAAIGAAGLGLTALFIWLLTDVVGIHYLVSKVITTVIVTGWNFAAKKIILF